MQYKLNRIRLADVGPGQDGERIIKKQHEEQVLQSLVRKAYIYGKQVVRLPCRAASLGTLRQIRQERCELLVGQIVYLAARA